MIVISNLCILVFNGKSCAILAHNLDVQKVISDSIALEKVSGMECMLVVSEFNEYLFFSLFYKGYISEVTEQVVNLTNQQLCG